MSYGKYAGQYLEADVMSRSPEWLVPLLYEHLLSGLRRAEVQIQSRDFEGKAQSLAKAADIILGLAESLDHEKGGEIAGRLGALYAYFLGEIRTVSRTLDLELLGKLIRMISELHEAWIKAAEQVAPRGRSASPGLSAAVA